MDFREIEAYFVSYMPNIKRIIHDETRHTRPSGQLKNDIAAGRMAHIAIRTPCFFRNVITVSIFCYGMIQIKLARQKRLNYGLSIKIFYGRRNFFMFLFCSAGEDEQSGNGITNKAC